MRMNLTILISLSVVGALTGGAGSASAMEPSDRFELSGWEARCTPGEPIYDTCRVRKTLQSGGTVEIIFSKKRIEIYSTNCNSNDGYVLRKTIKRKSKSNSSELMDEMGRFALPCGPEGASFAGDSVSTLNLFESATR